MAFDLYRAETCVYIKLEKYTDAATFLLRWGLATDNCNAINSQCEAYLSAIIVYLYARDFKQAEKCYNDCAQIDVFLGNDHGRCASKLLSAYSEGNIEEIKRVAQSSTISNLDHVRRCLGMPLDALGGLKTKRRRRRAFIAGLVLIFIGQISNLVIQLLSKVQFGPSTII
ncbi:gamma-soluble NSF attachment protein [Fagus crenata]